MGAHPPCYEGTQADSAGPMHNGTKVFSPRPSQQPAPSCQIHGGAFLEVQTLSLGRATPTEAMQWPQASLTAPAQTASSGAKSVPVVLSHHTEG